MRVKDGSVSLKITMKREVLVGFAFELRHFDLDNTRAGTMATRMGELTISNDSKHMSLAIGTQWRIKG